TRRMRAIQTGLRNLGPHLVPNWFDPDTDPCKIFKREDWVAAVVNEDTDDSYEAWAQDKLNDHGYGEQEFSRESCDCCGSNLAGSRHRFAILGEDDEVPTA
ncbi:MAG: hypothetical protein WA045_11805, partial [Nitrospira sp.]